MKKGLDIFLDSSAEWFNDSGLKKDSIVKVYKFMTVEKSYIKREIGILPTDIMHKVFSAVHGLLRP